MVVLKPTSDWKQTVDEESFKGEKYSENYCQQEEVHIHKIGMEKFSKTHRQCKLK